MDDEQVPETEVSLDREQRRLHDWRLQTLRGAGFSTLDAEVLACSTADLHRACDLVKAGCAPATARRILL